MSSNHESDHREKQVDTTCLSPWSDSELLKKTAGSDGSPYAPVRIGVADWVISVGCRHA